MLIVIKKNLRASEQESDKIQVQRRAWKNWQERIDPGRLVFIDETGVRTDMLRTYGRSLGGLPCLGSAPSGHWKTLTFIAALSLDGIRAPWCLDGSMTGEAFKAYLETQLLPSLKEGDIVVCDNLSSHKVSGIADLLSRKNSQILYLPAYSPDLNPIEQMFAKLKTLLRAAGERTFEALYDSIAHILEQFSHQEYSHYFTHCGYYHQSYHVAT